MTTMTTPPVTTVRPNFPFEVAFGATLVVSSASCTPVRVSDWTAFLVNVASRVPSEMMGTSTGQTVTSLPTVRTRAPGENISELRTLSGLTADQVGRLLGVSRRSVQNWVAGNAMAVQHEEKVSRLLSIIRALPGSTADERRGSLLDSSDGESLFHKLLAQRTEAGRVQGRPLSTGERVSL